VTGRPGAIGRGRVDADGGVHPNKYDPYVTAEFRVYWPPLATDAEIDRAIDDAIDGLRESIAERRQVVRRAHRATAVTEPHAIEWGTAIRYESEGKLVDPRPHSGGEDAARAAVGQVRHGGKLVAVWRYPLGWHEA
jgi:hypothetical protein